MQIRSIEKELRENAYPGRGIILGKSPDGKKAVAAYFIMGRSENSRNRIFVEDGEGIRCQVLKESPSGSRWRMRSMHLPIFCGTA